MQLYWKIKGQNHICIFKKVEGMFSQGTEEIFLQHNFPWAPSKHHKNVMQGAGAKIIISSRKAQIDFSLK